MAWGDHKIWAEQPDAFCNDCCELLVCDEREMYCPSCHRIFGVIVDGERLFDNHDGTPPVTVTFENCLFKMPPGSYRI
jgi:hypothetical protein